MHHLHTMGKRIILWTSIVLTCLLISVTTTTAENAVYLDYISISIPKNDVLIYQPSNTNTPKPINIPFMDIQHIYYNLNGLTMTVKIKMGANAVVNSSIGYIVNSLFYLNTSIIDFSVIAIYITKFSSFSQTLNSRYTVVMRNDQGDEIYSVTKETNMTSNGRYISWNIDLTGLNNYISVNQVFIKYSLFRTIQAKYEITPEFNVQSLNTYGSTTIRDFFKVDRVDPPTHSKYLWIFELGISSIICGVILFINRHRLRKSWQNRRMKNLSRNNELYPEDK